MRLLMGMLYLLLGLASGAQPPVRGVFNAVTELHRYDGCELVPTDWADGDSFSVRLPDGKDYTIRLYGVDCLETSGEDDTDARRLRAQRRYFGIAEFGGNPKASNNKAKEMGKAAKKRVSELLEGELTVHTAWADARGSVKFKRYYGFVRTAEGKDLAEVLVSEGLARAYGVYRLGPQGESGADYKERLRDLELQAARRGVGIWKFTDWDKFPEERQAERDEAAELDAAKDDKKAPAKNVDPNTASRDELMSLPGVGEKTALAIIEGREEGKYRKAEDLDRVPRIGKKTVEKLRPYLKFGPEGKAVEP
jgi:competence ComEA-like helix-hairpin-helix protein